MTSFISFVQSLTGDWTSEGLFTDLPRSPRSINAPGWCDNVTIFSVFLSNHWHVIRQIACVTTSPYYWRTFFDMSVSVEYTTIALWRILFLLSSHWHVTRQIACVTTSPFHCRTFSDIPKVQNWRFVILILILIVLSMVQKIYWMHPADIQLCLQIRIAS